MTPLTPVQDPAELVEKLTPRPPGQKCHSVDARGFAYCGAFGPRLDADGQQDRSHLHTRRECRARGHRHCVTCDEINRQLGDEGMAA